MLKKVLSYSISLYAVSLLASLLRIVVKSMIAKTAGKEALGAYTFYMSVLTLGAALLAFGLRRAITKYVAATKDDSQAAPVVVGIMVIGIAASILLAGLGVLLSRFIEWIYVLVLFSVGPYTLYEIARSTLRGQLDQKREVIAAFLGVTVQAGSTILFLLFSKDTFTPAAGVAFGNVLLAIGISAYFIRRYTRHWQPTELSHIYRSSAFRGLILLAGPLWITDILGIIGNQADQLIVQGSLGYLMLAEYGAAFTFIGLLDQPITVLSRVFLVTFSGGYYSDFDQYKSVSSLNLLVFSMLGMLVVSIAGPLTPILFTNEYTLVPLLVMILSVSSIFNSVEVLNTSLTIASDFPQANRDSKIWTTILYIPLLFWLVSRFGVIGAACGNAISWGIYALAHALYMRRKLPDHAAFTIRALFLGTSLYIFAIWVNYSVHNILLTPLIMLIYLGVGHLLRLWDLSTLPNIVRRLLPKRFALQASGHSANVFDPQSHDKETIP